MISNQRSIDLLLPWLIRKFSSVFLGKSSPVSMGLLRYATHVQSVIQNGFYFYIHSDSEIEKCIMFYVFFDS